MGQKNIRPPERDFFTGRMPCRRKQLRERRSSREEHFPGEGGSSWLLMYPVIKSLMYLDGMVPCCNPQSVLVRDMRKFIDEFKMAINQQRIKTDRGDA